MPAGYTDSDVDAAVPPAPDATHRPKAGLVNGLLKTIRNALDTTVSATWGAIGGTLASQADLKAALDAKAALSHSHSLTGGTLTGFGSAAPLNVPATGDAASGEVVKGNDSRLTNARAPTSHGHAESDIAGLAADLATAKLDPINIPGFVPAVGTYTLEEYAEAGGSISRITHRLAAGTMTYKIQIGGVDVTGLTSLSPTSVQAQASATGANAFAAGQRTTLVVTAVGSPGLFSATLKRALT